MSHPKIPRLLAAFFAAVALCATGQTTPADGVPRVAAADYLSAFGDYKPFSEEEPVAWRVANDTVGNIGGGRASASASEQSPAAARPQAAGQRPPAAAPETTANPHSGHRH